MANSLAMARHFVSLFVVLVHFFLFFSGVSADVPLHTNLSSYQESDVGKKPAQRFHSAPHLGAPIYQVNTFDHEKVDKAPYIFLTGNYSGAGVGPSIISSKDLSLVWADEQYGVSQAAQAYIFKGERVLAVYAGDHIKVYNQHYEQLYQIHSQGDPSRVSPDDHECYLTAENTVILQFGRDVMPFDMTPIGGPEEGDGVRDRIFQEIDPVTNQVLFEFSTLQHFGLNDSIWPYKGEGVFDMGPFPHDFCHMNSIQKTPEGDYLVSYRHLNCIILVDGKTSELKWIMGGKRNQFKDITVNGTATFSYQHQPRLTGKNRFTLFDNAGIKNGLCKDGEGSPCSRGLEIEYDPEAMTVKMVNEWHHPQSIITASRGGVQRLANGGTLVAWGQNAGITEHSPDGEVVMDIQRSQFVISEHGYPPLIIYRAWKGDWEGKPSWGPNISSNVEDGKRSIYVSWNGATAVENWVLLLSSNQTNLDGPEKVANTLPRLGFETGFELQLPLAASFARIAALNENGDIIGSTPGVHIETGQLYPLDYEITKVRTDEDIPTAEHSDPKGSIYSANFVAYGDIDIDIASMPFYFASALAVGLGIVLIRVLHTRRPAYGPHRQI
ncbi:Fc.00g017520.m01.CDS01 [Cosmosporella sp. VM-42]